MPDAQCFGLKQLLIAGGVAHPLPVGPEALRIEQRVGGDPHNLGSKIQCQRLVYPAQRLPQVRHEADLLIAPGRKLHIEPGLDELNVLLRAGQLLHSMCICLSTEGSA